MLYNLIILALVGGALLPVQAAINAKISSYFAAPMMGALVSFFVGTLALLLVMPLTGARMPEWSRLSQAPWWAWSGGVLGAAYVMIAVMGAPRLGTAVLMAVTVLGQMVAAMIIDHYGYLGLPVNPATPARLIGCLLVCAGVFLLMKK